MTTKYFKGIEASIVLIGSFNPSIFHPEWFARNDIIPAYDLEGVNLEVVHPEVAKFTFPWLLIEILQNRFLAKTSDEAQFGPLRDFAISTFTLLEHTPISKLGMNVSIDYQVSSESEWHKVGDTLAPKNIWSHSLPGRVGLTSLKVSSPRDDGISGQFNVTIEARPNLGINFNINNHIDIEDEYNVCDIINRLWEDSIVKSKEIADKTLNGALI